MKTIRTTCPYCGVGCGLLADKNSKIIGDPEHPANFGRLCSKGAALGETLDLEGRLLTPQINGNHANWDQALDLVAQKFTSTIEKHGPDSVAFYVSGQLLSEDYYVANKLMKGFIGSANIDTNSRLCMASSVVAHKRAFGSDSVPLIYEDLEKADTIVLVGSNLAWCHPVLFQRIIEAKSVRPEMKIIAIDPRYTASAKVADLHLSIKADSDTALFNSLLSEISRRGKVDKKYIAAHVNGFKETLAMAKSSDPLDTGLSPEDINSFYDLWIASKKTVTIFSQGVNQSSGGSNKANAIINCHLATGRIGHQGMGPFSITGQPNAMGGREVGGLANMLACHLDIENSKHRQMVQQHWQAPTICTKTGLKALDMFAACASGKIKALWIMATNPAVSMPNSDAIVAAIKNVEFSVTSEVMSKTDTSILTDVQLPATAWGEKTGTVSNSERRISMQRAFLPPPKKARPDWQIICEVGKRMGWEKAFSYNGPAEIFREYATLSGKAAAKGIDFDISGLATISDSAYADLEPVQWPVAKSGNRGGRFFGEGKFFHPDNKARMIPVEAMQIAKNKDRVFRLNTGRIRDQWHTMTRTAKSPRLSQHKSEPFVEIHPDDAKKTGVAKGDLIEIKSLTSPMQKTSKSRVIARVAISKHIQCGMIFAPMHWSLSNSASGRINTMVEDNCDPFSGQPALKGSNVSLIPFKAVWHGFAVSTSPIKTNLSYSATARTNNGWSCEMASRTDIASLADIADIADWEALARSVLNLQDGNASMIYDAAKAVARIAIYNGAKLSGLFFSAPNPLSIERSYAVSLIGSNVSPLAALAGLPKTDQPNPGRTICACFNVGINTIDKAVRGGANNIVSLGKKTAAGTNCGSCKPELQAIIDNIPMIMAKACLPKVGTGFGVKDLAKTNR